MPRSTISHRIRLKIIGKALDRVVRADGDDVAGMRGQRRRQTEQCLDGERCVAAGFEASPSPGRGGVSHLGQPLLVVQEPGEHTGKRLR